MHLCFGFTFAAADASRRYIYIYGSYVLFNRIFCVLGYPGSQLLVPHCYRIHDNKDFIRSFTSWILSFDYKPLSVKMIRITHRICSKSSHLFVAFGGKIWKMLFDCGWWISSKLMQLAPSVWKWCELDIQTHIFYRLYDNNEHLLLSANRHCQGQLGSLKALFVGIDFELFCIRIVISATLERF